MEGGGRGESPSIDCGRLGEMSLVEAPTATITPMESIYQWRSIITVVLSRVGLRVGGGGEGVEEKEAGDRIRI